MTERKSYLDDDDNILELDEQFFREATRGRPKLPAEKRKQQITTLVDPDVLAFFKAGGKGWQTRMNTALREVAGLDR